MALINWYTRLQCQNKEHFWPFHIVSEPRKKVAFKVYPSHQVLKRNVRSCIDKLISTPFGMIHPLFLKKLDCAA